MPKSSVGQQIPLGVDRSTVDLLDSLGVSFPSLADVTGAAGFAYDRMGQPSVMDPRTGLVRRWTVRVGPGLVQLLTTTRGNDPGDWRAAHEPWCDQLVMNENEPCSCGAMDSDRTTGCASCPLAVQRVHYPTSSNGAVRHEGPPTVQRVENYAVWRPRAQRWEAEPPPTRRILSWSAKSRANMVRTIVGLDWLALLEGMPAGWRPVMWTVTMPRDWVPLAPTGRVFKRQLQNLWKRWERRWGSGWAGVWKQEFQRRGAPHAHCYGPAPAGRVFREWLSVAWCEVVWGLDLGWVEGEAWSGLLARVEREHGKGVRDHLSAGAGVDWGEGARAIDPKRLGVYFAKRTAAHNTGRSKEYQHVVPAEWMGAGNGPGRWWGYRGMDKATVDVEVDGVTFVAMKRLLARHTKAQRRTSVTRARRLDEETGEILDGRKRTRRYRLRALDGGGERAGAFVLLNDAPGWLMQAARWWALHAGTAPPSDRMARPLAALP